MIVAEEIAHRERKRLIETLRKLEALEDEEKIRKGLEELAVDLRTRREIAGLVKEGRFQIFSERLERLLDKAVKDGVISRSKVLAKNIVYRWFREKGLVPRDIWDLYTMFLQKRSKEAHGYSVVYGYTLKELERELIKIKEGRTSAKDAAKRVREALERAEDFNYMEGHALMKDLLDMYWARAPFLLASEEGALKGRAEIEVLKEVADAVMQGLEGIPGGQLSAKKGEIARNITKIQKALPYLLAGEYLDRYVRKIAEKLGADPKIIREAVKNALSVAERALHNKHPDTVRVWAEEMIKTYPRLAAAFDVALRVEDPRIKRKALMRIFRNAAYGVE